MTRRPTPAALHDVDLLDLVDDTGCFWADSQHSLVSLGSVHRVEVDRHDGAAAADAVRDAGGTDRGFVAMSFADAPTMSVLVPDLIVGEDANGRWVEGSMSDRELIGLVERQVETRIEPVAVADMTMHHPARAWLDDVVAVGRGRVRSGALRKVVCARSLELTADRPWPIAPIIRSLRARFSAAQVFHIDGLVGASPELLVGRTGRSVFAHPLAGTAARAADPDLDRERLDELLASGKDQIEHRITIDWLLAELLPFCSYVDAEPAPTVLSMENVHHLGTRVEGVLSEPAASVIDLVSAVHPTPAVAGAPQGDALAAIAELEGVDRGAYAGPAGWFDSDGNGAFAVSVRTASIAGERATVWAGVGVVAESDLDAELAETQAKFGAMLGTLLAPGVARSD